MYYFWSYLEPFILDSKPKLEIENQKFFGQLKKSITHTIFKFRVSSFDFEFQLRVSTSSFEKKLNFCVTLPFYQKYILEFCAYRKLLVSFNENVLKYVPKGIYSRYNEGKSRQYYRMDRPSRNDSVFLEWKQLDYKSSGWFIYGADSKNGKNGITEPYFYAKADSKHACPSKIQSWVPAIYYKDCWINMFLRNF